MNYFSNFSFFSTQKKNRSLDCESSESQITATEASEPGTKKCKITEE